VAHTDEHESVEFERRDANTGRVVSFAVWLAIVVALVFGIMWVLLRELTQRERSAQRAIPPIVAASLERTPPEPRLEAAPLAPRRRLNEEENAILATYGWVDRASGIVRLPIDRALELTAERGVPGGKPMAAGTAPAATPAAGAKP
jgi:hypothetical protein